MTTAYVYKWTHIPSLRWYVGSRTAKGCHPEDGYVCSNITLVEMIETKPHEWSREIIATGSKEEMYEFETTILEIFDARHDPRSFNGHNNDFGIPVSGEKHYMKQDKWRKIQSERTSGEKNPRYGKGLFGEANGMFGVDRPEEWRESMRGSNNPLLKDEHQLSCPVCEKTMPKNVYHLWGHGETCGLSNQNKLDLSKRMTGKNNPMYGSTPYNKVVKLHTPLGWFNSVKEASESHKVCEGTILYRIKSKNEKFKEYYK